MKALLFTITSLFTNAVFCQQELPAYGKIDKADLLLTECPFDSSAAAYKLLDYGKVWFAKSEWVTDAQRMSNGRIELKIVTERRVRIKILKSRALDLANVTIPYFGEEEELKQVDGCTYNLDEGGNIQVINISKNDIYKRKSPSGSNELVMVLPGVKAGSIIEYKYTIHTEDDSYVRDWYFQDDIPTRTSYYNVSIPQAYPFSEESYFRQPASVQQKVEYAFYGSGAFSMTVPVLKKTVMMENIPAMTAEPFMGAAKDYLQRIMYHRVPETDVKKKEPDNITQWRKFASVYEKNLDVAKQLTVSIPHTAELVERLQKEKDTAVIIKSLCDFISSHISWNGKMGIFSSPDPRTAWDKGSGSSNDINIMLINLLRKTGIAAYPLLTSTAGHGLVLPEMVSYRQFNILLTYIPADSGFYVIDATDKVQHPGLIPGEVLTAKGLVVDGEKSFLADLSDTKERYGQLTSVLLMMEKDGTAKGQAIISSGGYARAERVESWKSDPKKFEVEFLHPANTALIIDSVQVNNEANGKQPFEQTAWFGMKLNSSGTYYYVTTNLFTGLTENPFLASNRVSPVNFRHLQRYDMYFSINLPDGFVFDALPKNTTMTTADKSITFSRQLSATDNLLNLKITLDLKQVVYPADDYPALQEYYKKMFNLLAEQIVIKKVR
jgi:transglutaminase-like putative cysteine protease